MKKCPLIITPDHVRGSKRREPLHCPTARAIKDQYGVAVRVGAFDLGHIDDLTWHTRHSEDLKLTILQFDSGAPFRTGVYFIELPDEIASK